MPIMPGLRQSQMPGVGWVGKRAPPRIHHPSCFVRRWSGARQARPEGNEEKEKAELLLGRREREPSRLSERRSSSQPPLEVGWAGPAAALARPASPHGRRHVFFPPFLACGNKSGDAERSGRGTRRSRAGGRHTYLRFPLLPSTQPCPPLAHRRPPVLRLARSPCRSEKAAWEVWLDGPLSRKGEKGGG